MARKSKASADPSSLSSFQTVGVKTATSFNSPSGMASPNTKLRPKKLAGGGGFLEAATAAHRPGIQENMGAQLHPSAVLYAPNAAAAQETQRNTVFMPSVMGQARNFWAKRAEGRRI